MVVSTMDNVREEKIIAKAPSLRSNRDFVKFWSAHTISAIGSKVTFLALPLTAALVLQATPVEMGYLAVAGSLPRLLFGLLVGVWVDRRQRRALLVLADVGRGVLLLLIPLAAWLGLLQMSLLYAVLFLIGSLGLLFGAADHAYLPSLVQREELVDANSKLAISRSAAEIAGPTLADPGGCALLSALWFVVELHSSSGDRARAPCRGWSFLPGN
jgi:MFS family permease